MGIFKFIILLLLLVGEIAVGYSYITTVIKVFRELDRLEKLEKEEKPF